MFLCSVSGCRSVKFRRVKVKTVIVSLTAEFTHSGIKRSPNPTPQPHRKPFAWYSTSTYSRAHTGSESCPIYNPERACLYCKYLAHIDKYCPERKACIYCKGDHNIIECTRATCKRCKTKGHHQLVCPNMPECTLSRRKEALAHHTYLLTLSGSFRRWLEPVSKQIRAAWMFSITSKRPTSTSESVFLERRISDLRVGNQVQLQFHLTEAPTPYAYVKKAQPKDPASWLAVFIKKIRKNGSFHTWLSSHGELLVKILIALWTLWKGTHWRNQNHSVADGTYRGGPGPLWETYFIPDMILQARDILP